MMTRGERVWVKKFIENLEAQYFPFKYDGKDIALALGVRPLQLWELVMPKEQLQLVMKTIWEKDPVFNWKGKAHLEALRLGLGAKKIPKIDPKAPFRIVKKDQLGIYPIGIKEDLYDEKHKCEML